MVPTLSGVLTKARNDSVASHQPLQLGLDAVESSTSAHLGYLEQRNQNREDILKSQITMFLRCFSLLLDILIMVNLQGFRTLLTLG